jgi:hypothetical protein
MLLLTGKWAKPGNLSKFKHLSENGKSGWKSPLLFVLNWLIM